MTGNTVGLQRSVALMQALGPDAEGVWARLPSDAAQQLSAAMDEVPPDASLAEEAASQLLSGRAAGGSARPGAAGGVDITKLAAALSGEPPHIVALALRRLAPAEAAVLLEALPSCLSAPALTQLLEGGTPREESLAILDPLLEMTVAQGTQPKLGEQKVAQIFDELDQGAETSFLSAIDQMSPGSGARIRTLMFSFDDLPGLSRAGLQTLLAKADRSSLTLALKGDPTPVRAALLENMTQRAQQALLEDIHALGPVRRSEIRAAQKTLARLVRSLIRSGDILAPGTNEMDELVE